jgi:hypothetical protein
VARGACDLENLVNEAIARVGLQRHIEKKFYPYAYDIVIRDLVIFKRTVLCINSWNKPENGSLA